MSVKGSFLTFFLMLQVDPYQLRNIYLTLSDSELNFMHQQLKVLKEQGTEFSGPNGDHSHLNHLGSMARQRSFIKRFGKKSIFPRLTSLRKLYIFRPISAAS